MSLLISPHVLIRQASKGLRPSLKTTLSPSSSHYLRCRFPGHVRRFQTNDVLPKFEHGQIKVFQHKDPRGYGGYYVDIPPVWLRDHCRCSRCFHPITKQRLIETFDEIPADIAFAKGSVIEDAAGFTVTWNDGHKSHYSKHWLNATLNYADRTAERQGLVDMEFWTGESIKNNPPVVEYNDVMNSEDGLKNWLYLIRKFGFSFVDNCPQTPEATKSLLERIAFIRPTHYGGFYDFTSDLSKGDTAYTQLGIGAHTDTTYFTEPVGLQLFHLLSHTDGEGGITQLVDGFGAASNLYRKDSDAYYVLSKTNVYSHASGNEDSSLQPFRPSPTFMHNRLEDRDMQQVKWNTADRARIELAPDELGFWYEAARKWTDELKSNSYWVPLRPGRPLIFDNWRVLHGRSAFTGKRRMCGGYINRDDFISKFKMTNWGREKTLSHVC